MMTNYSEWNRVAYFWAKPYLTTCGELSTLGGMNDADFSLRIPNLIHLHGTSPFNQGGMIRGRIELDTNAEIANISKMEVDIFDAQKA